MRREINSALVWKWCQKDEVLFEGKSVTDEDLRLVHVMQEALRRLACSLLHNLYTMFYVMVVTVSYGNL